MLLIDVANPCVLQAPYMVSKTMPGIIPKIKGESSVYHWV